MHVCNYIYISLSLSLCSVAAICCFNALGFKVLPIQRKKPDKSSSDHVPLWFPGASRAILKGFELETEN